jgi:hypothetical protein
VGPGQAPDKSRTGPDQVPGGSRSSPGQVLVKFRVGPGQVPSWSRAGPGQVPVRSRVSLGRVCQFKNEMLKIGNWFTVLKTVNHFLKIKEEFSVKGKMFSIDYYFTSQ